MTTKTWDGKGRHPNTPALSTLDTIRTPGIWDFMRGDEHLGYAEVTDDGRAFIFDIMGILQSKQTTALNVELLAKTRGITLDFRGPAYVPAK